MAKSEFPPPISDRTYGSVPKKTIASKMQGLFTDPLKALARGFQSIGHSTHTFFATPPSQSSSDSSKITALADKVKMLLYKNSPQKINIRKFEANRLDPEAKFTAIREMGLEHAMTKYGGKVSLDAQKINNHLKMRFFSSDRKLSEEEYTVLSSYIKDELLENIINDDFSLDPDKFDEFYSLVDTLQKNLTTQQKTKLNKDINWFIAKNQYKLQQANKYINEELFPPETPEQRKKNDDELKEFGDIAPGHPQKKKEKIKAAGARELIFGKGQLQDLFANPKLKSIIVSESHENPIDPKTPYNITKVFQHIEKQTRPPFVLKKRASELPQQQESISEKIYEPDPNDPDIFELDPDRAQSQPTLEEAVPEDVSISVTDFEGNLNVIDANDITSGAYKAYQGTVFCGDKKANTACVLRAKKTSSKPIEDRVRVQKLEFTVGGQSVTTTLALSADGNAGYQVSEHFASNVHDAFQKSLNKLLQDNDSLSESIVARALMNTHEALEDQWVELVQAGKGKIGPNSTFNAVFLYPENDKIKGAAYNSGDSKAILIDLTAEENDVLPLHAPRGRTVGFFEAKPEAVVLMSSDGLWHTASPKMVSEFLKDPNKGNLNQDSSQSDLLRAVETLTKHSAGGQEDDRNIILMKF